MPRYREVTANIIYKRFGSFSNDALLRQTEKFKNHLSILLLSYLTPKFWRLDSDLDLMKNVLLLMESVLNALISAIHGLSTSIFRAKGDEDLLCGANVAIGNIRAYMQHQIKDTQ